MAAPAGWRAVARTAVKVIASVVQVLLLARIAVLFLVPPGTDPIVTGLLDLSQPLVDPFRDAVRASLRDAGSGTVLDVHAMAALRGYTIIELVALWLIRWRRRRSEPMPPSPREATAIDPSGEASRGDSA
jgi:uncharacterized protein YggT (Ycf19 family)